MCEANDDIDGIIPCDFSGYVDMSTPGTYIVTYYAIDSAGNEAFLAVQHTVTDPSNPDSGLELTEYYSSASGLSGNDLLIALRAIVNNGMVKFSYGDSRYILNETDRDPLNPDNVILLYLGTSVSGVWDDGDTWNREHVWPQSLMMTTTLSNSSKNIGSDLHNLKPANPNANSSRGNSYYDNSLLILGNPVRPEVRGDIARILFYMVVMYDYLELVNTTPTLYQMAMLDILIGWHDADPVDSFEINRNNVIFSYQHNRNPFIDYPEFVDLIYSP